MASTISLFVFLFFTSSVYANEQQYTSLDFQSFVELVEKSHPDNAIDQISSSRAALIEKKVGILSNPEITFGRENANFTSARMSEKSLEPMWSVQVKQTIPWPGTLSAESDSALAVAKKVEIEAKLSAARRRIEAKIIYLNIVTTYRLLELERGNLAVATSVLKNASARLKFGVGLHHEVIHAQNDQTILLANIQSEETNLANLKDYAALWIGKEDAATLEFVYSIPENLGLVKVSEDATQEKLLANQNETISKLEAERKKSLPSFMLSGSLMHNDSGMKQYSLMAGITVPIFSHEIGQNIESEKIHESQQTNANLDLYAKKKKLALVQIQRRKSSIQNNLQILKQDILPNLKQHLKSLLSDYALGKADFSTINQTRRSLLKYQRTEVLTEQALFITQLSQEKIEAGFLEDELAQNIATLPGADMTEDNNMESSKMDSSPSSPKKADEPSKKMQESQPEEEQGRKGGMGGMP